MDVPSGTRPPTTNKRSNDKDRQGKNETSIKKQVELSGILFDTTRNKTLTGMPVVNKRETYSSVSRGKEKREESRDRTIDKDTDDAHRQSSKRISHRIYVEIKGSLRKGKRKSRQ